jgi:hypothetical protein
VWLGASRRGPISQIDDSTGNLRVVIATQHNPSRQANHNQHAGGDREYHSRPASAIVRLKPQEIPVAGATGGQMIQVRFRLGQRHPVRSNCSDNLVTRASNALGIRELVTKPSTQCS